MKTIRLDASQKSMENDSSSDGDTKRWSGWSVTRGEVFTSLDPGLVVLNNEESSRSAKSGNSRKSSSGRARGVFPCERCGRTYVRKDSLQRHLQWECGKEPTFQCPFCPQRCKRKAHQIRHIRRQHSDMINFIDLKDNPVIMEVLDS